MAPASGPLSWRARADGWRARFAPRIPVRLLRADGSHSYWIGDERLAATPAGPLDHVALELPEELVLRRSLVLPPLAPADAREAAALEVRASSPFPSDDTLWGLAPPAPGSGGATEIAITSRRAVEAFLADRRVDPARLKTPPEVWVLAANGRPIVLPGFGEAARTERAATSRRVHLGLGVVAAALLVLLAVTPTVQLRARAIQAVQAMDELHARTLALVGQREELRGLEDRLKEMETAAADRIDPALAMEVLTRALPDDAFLITLELRAGGRGVMTGQTADAAALLQKLTVDPGLREVRTVGASSKERGAARESFTIEFQLAQATITAAPGASPVANAAALLPVAPVAVLPIAPASATPREVANAQARQANTNFAAQAAQNFQAEMARRARSAGSSPLLAAPPPAAPAEPPPPPQKYDPSKPPPFAIGGSR